MRGIERYKPGCSLAAGSLMIKWGMMDQHLALSKIKIIEGDTVNVFISMESIMENMSKYKGLNSSIFMFKQDIVLEIESAILNVAANYKMYFDRKKCKSNIYFYHTKIGNNNMDMKIINEHYRNYYDKFYMSNPMNKNIGKLLVDNIIPEIKLITSYINGCYVIETDTIDGSLVPLLISNMDSNKKNVLVTSDIFDTLYLYDPNFCVMYVMREYANFSMASDSQGVLNMILPNENAHDVNIFNSELYFRLLLSIIGNDKRNIRSSYGFNITKLIRILNKGIDKGVVLNSFNSIDSVINAFPTEHQNDIKAAFNCLELNKHTALAGDFIIDSIKSQIIDNVDNASLEALNNKRFIDYPINLQALIH